ncbi:MAG: lipopolysaccharide heptosyltransferase II [Gemmataceae bacterium]|nr:lipopolysaccharide heptosyltransferase II [Gemmataceae bacterium]MDW8266198.1 lipopolysaccharide heptosyltransferase II [Gemmataceae bacterium]
MNIALFLPNWVGDAVMATPAIRAVRQHFAGARLVAVLKPYVAGVFEGAPWFDQLFFLDSRGPWSQRWFAIAARLRREGIDLALLFPNSFRSALVAWSGRCRRRVGYARYGRGFLLTDRLSPPRDRLGRIPPHPVLLAYNRLAQWIGCPQPSLRMELFTTAADEAAADRLWDEAGLATFAEAVALNPGAAYGSAKLWPAEYFALLARRLAVERGSGVLVLCGPSERDLARRIVAEARHPAVRSLADAPVSLGLTKACLKRVDLLITTDSGPRHFATAFGRPVITLFGPTHIAWTETYHPWAVHLQKPVSCGPCQLRRCPMDHRCMTTLRPDEVFRVAAHLLQRWAEARGVGVPRATG